ncbi:hypothetical protein AS591_09460 [Stenotrophomonas maltophilia]|nr:hypothetical protein AS591_09460 [Stenotrophomonas maltophilia]
MIGGRTRSQQCVLPDDRAELRKHAALHLHHRLHQHRADDLAHALGTDQGHRTLQAFHRPLMHLVGRAVGDAQQISGQHRVLADDRRHHPCRGGIVVDGLDQLRQQLRAPWQVPGGPVSVLQRARHRFAQCRILHGGRLASQPWVQSKCMQAALQVGGDLTGLQGLALKAGCGSSDRLSRYGRQAQRSRPGRARQPAAQRSPPGRRHRRLPCRCGALAVTDRPASSRESGHPPSSQHRPHFHLL